MTGILRFSFTLNLVSGMNTGKRNSFALRDMSEYVRFLQFVFLSDARLDFIKGK